MYAARFARLHIAHQAIQRDGGAGQLWHVGNEFVDMLNQPDTAGKQQQRAQRVVTERCAAGILPRDAAFGQRRTGAPTCQLCPDAHAPVTGLAA